LSESWYRRPNALLSAGLAETDNAAAPERTVTAGHSKLSGTVATALLSPAAGALDPNQPETDGSDPDEQPPSAGPRRTSAASKPRRRDHNCGIPLPTERTLRAILANEQ
jgi:hypothetical protein